MNAGGRYKWIAFACPEYGYFLRLGFCNHFLRLIS